MATDYPRYPPARPMRVAIFDAILSGHLRGQLTTREPAATAVRGRTGAMA
jgi:hypothetical protein